MPGIGTLINIITVLIGGTVGLLLGERVSENMKEAVMRGLGLLTLVLGFRMALGTENIFISMGSIVFGGILGTWWQLETRLDELGDRFERRFEQTVGEFGGSGNFSKGFVTASLVFCVGPITVLGAIEDGLVGNFKLLAIKSGLDGFAAMAFASTLGVGVLFSVITLIVYQGGLTYAAALFSGTLAGVDVSNSLAVNELSATGGILIIGIGLLLLEIADLKVSNYLPALFIAPLIVGLLTTFGITI
uniref:Membrane protein containing DUF554 n=1 Tax=uncultured organism TaxID=155900 RepID=M1Q0S3_9ZZZZ|nr:membrane protein containing DUF554 [uncultured organism]